MRKSTPTHEGQLDVTASKCDQRTNPLGGDDCATNASQHPSTQPRDNTDETITETNYHLYTIPAVTDAATAMVIEAHQKTMAYANPNEKANSQSASAKQQQQRDSLKQPQQKEKLPPSPLVTPPMNSSVSPKSPRTSDLLSSSAVAAGRGGVESQQNTAQEKQNRSEEEGGGAGANEASLGNAQAASHGFYTEYAKGSVQSASAAGSLYADVPVSRDPQQAAGATATEAASKKGPIAKGGNNNKPKGVPHVYHDYSQVSGPGPAYVRKKSGGVTVPFPEKLHEMLDAESSDDPSSGIVSWMPHGRAFIVRRPKEFTANIMPKYFRQTKLTSFQRQLNLYGFRRITQGADSGAYYHELFLQGRPSLSQRMVRQKVKGTGHKQPADVSSEPNFYAMPPVEAEHQQEVFAGTRYKPTIMPPTSASAVIPSSTANAATGSPNPPNSPGLVSVQGAAHVLHGFASSFAADGGTGTAFLGASATTGGTTGEGKCEEKAPKGTPASFLPPPQDNAAV